LRLEDELVERAKRRAEEAGKSVSQLVADYFALLERERDVHEATLPPITRSLSGILEGVDLGEEDYYRHLEEKHA